MVSTSNHNQSSGYIHNDGVSFREATSSAKSITPPARSFFKSIGNKFKPLFRCRLCWRVTLAIFVAIFVVEALILIPSYRNYERDLLVRLEMAGKSVLITAVTARADNSSPSEFAILGNKLTGSTVVSGAVLHTDAGRIITSFGSLPLSISLNRPARSPDGDAYDITWKSGQLGAPFAITARLDSSHIRAELLAFVGRIIALVAFIAVFVTVAAMTVLNHSVLLPIFALREKLQGASEDFGNLDKYSVPYSREDEWNDVIKAFNRLLQRNASNIREIKAQKQRLKNSELRYRELFEDAPIAYFTISHADDGSHANDECVLGQFNNGLSELLGYTRDELKQRPVCDLYANTQSGSKMAKQLFEDLRSGNTKSLLNEELQMQKNNGDIIWVTLSADPVMGKNGTAIEIRCVARDITERKWAEMQLRIAKDAAEAGSRAKSSFLSNMSHELRTPLNSILGFTQLIQLSPNEKPTRSQKEYLDIIASAGDHLLQLINEVLDLAKIESGKAVINIEELDPDNVIEECLTLTQSLASTNSIRIEKHTTSNQEKTSALVKADPLRLRQALTNLLSNAVKYNTNGGYVRVGYHLKNSSTLRFTVKDTGVGIAVEKQGDIFVPFNRLGAEASNIEGTGIGLSLTKSLVEQMDGSIDFDSSLGKGSEFWIDLPIASGVIIPEISASPEIPTLIEPAGDNI